MSPKKYRPKYRANIAEQAGSLIRAYYHRWWACPRGKHWMKMDGCVYCGKQPEGGQMT